MSNKIQINCNQENKARKNLLKKDWERLEACYIEIKQAQETIKDLESNNIQKYMHPCLLNQPYNIEALKSRLYENELEKIRSLEESVKTYRLWIKIISSELSYLDLLVKNLLQMEKKDKGKRKLIQPTQRSTSSMSTSSEEEKKIANTEKLMQSAINAQTEKIHNYSQQPQLLQGLNIMIPSQSTQSFNQVIKPQASSYYNTRSSKNTQSSQQKIDSVITFGNYALQKCYDVNKKFRPIVGMGLTEEQQCLLDNLWHIQTVPQASTFKVQVLNALSIYFAEQNQNTPKIQHKRFSHYVIFRGTKTGIFNKWETVAKYIQCPQPIYKGYYSFADALKAARENFGLNNFHIEPEEVKTFSEIAKTHPEQMIKAQEETISNLQKQLVQSGKNQQSIQIQIDNSILKQKNLILEEKISQLQKQFEEKESKTVLHRDYNSFKARILDIPWKHTMKPILDRMPELENIISTKVLMEFPMIFYTLQRKIVDIYFQENQYPGVTVVQSLTHSGILSETLRLQINLKQTKMTDDEILSFYHHGMIDYLEFSFSTRTENLLNKLGEKFILTAGNIASYTDAPLVGCKIFSSFPEATSSTYRPARKRIFISHRESEQRYFKDLACTKQLNLESIILKRLEENATDILASWVKQEQATPPLPYRFKWTEYKLLAEGYYIQIWSHFNWDMLFPFIGERDHISILDINNKEDDTDSQPDNESPQSIPSTHRDF